MAWEVTNSQRKVSKGTSPTKFFDDLSADVKKKADRIIKDHSDMMKDTLRYRFPLGKGDGRYPRWDYSFDSAQKSKESYKFWSVHKVRDGVYQLQNTATDPFTEYAYPLALVNGVGWNKHITGKHGPWLRLVNHNGKVFSRQMPRGLAPWIGRKKTELKHKLKEGIGDIT